MFKVKFFNENGNVSAKVRNAMKEQALSKTLAVFAKDGQLNGAVKNANGGISIPLAENENGEIVYANYELTVSTKDPSIKDERKKKSVKKDSGAEPVVSLFDSED